MKYFIKYGNISEIFHEIFQHQKYRILYITSCLLTGGEVINTPWPDPHVKGIK